MNVEINNISIRVEGIYDYCLLERYNHYSTHGGQIILPFVGGVYDSKLGFFLEKISGRLDSNDTIVIVSNGIDGSNEMLPRLNNKPEIVVLDCFYMLGLVSKRWFSEVLCEKCVQGKIIWKPIYNYICNSTERRRLQEINI